jgi:hypothetical protein
MPAYRVFPLEHTTEDGHVGEGIILLAVDNLPELKIYLTLEDDNGALIEEGGVPANAFGVTTST